jgi:hypothetical protein
MSKYYYLIAGLPNLSIDDNKLPFSVAEFREDLTDNHLSADDVRLLDLFFLKFDNKNLLEQLRHPDYDLDSRGKITCDEFNELFNGIREETEGINRNKRFPPYFEAFVRMFLAAQEKQEKEEPPVVAWEDRLSALYYDYAMKSKNAFAAAWFELNLNMNNILTAITCRKYNLDRAAYIVGNNEAANSLRTSNARDFGLGDALEYLPSALRIAEESDLLLREHKTDRLKWEWLDAQTFYKTFDMESVLTYLLKLEMTERWALLDKAAGEQTFRNLVGAMKKGSMNTLEEFKRNNQK